MAMLEHKLHGIPEGSQFGYRDVLAPGETHFKQALTDALCGFDSGDASCLASLKAV